MEKPRAPGPLQMVFSITAGAAPAPPRAPSHELVVSEMSYHADALRPVLVGPSV